jgi:heptosyltransferase-2
MTYTRTFLRRINDALHAVLTAFSRSHTNGLAAVPLPRPVRRVLLVKLVGMGDAVLVRSLAEHLRRARPDLEIGVLAGPLTHEVLGPNSNFVVHLYDPDGADQGIWAALRKIREIRGRSYDVVVDFEQHILLVAFFLWLTGVRYRIGLAAEDNPRSIFQSHTIRLSGEESMWKAYTALARIVEPSLDGITTLPLARSESVVSDIDRWWERNGLNGDGRIVAFHLGCGSRAVARRWPVIRFVQLAERLAEAGQADAIVLTGTRDEQPLVGEFAASFRGHAVDATGLDSVQHTAEVVRRCHLVVSNDTGLMHLAAAMGTPTVGLFGPNSPVRYAPVGSRTVSVYTTHVACSPCIHIHRGIVPECFADEKGRCLLDIDVGTVFAAAQRSLFSASPEPVSKRVGLS